MVRLITFAVLAGGLTFSMQVRSLAMGPAEFAASGKLACVLAEESLGYVSKTEYGNLTEQVLEGFDQQESDAIYAKALGYYDGLMFGIPAGDQERVYSRLRNFVSSKACAFSAPVNVLI
ncbi:hypothetical protein [Candidatus Litorirhabdus singularis]|uniref:hypothetical protein n=1 Tax=Candidatus Litorirhabdus singularis TaxID=2518993 RepID=UPI00242D7600|nr:hypothetical protein [Candidatus Litorirhabdus singularis]